MKAKKLGYKLLVMGIAIFGLIGWCNRIPQEIREEKRIVQQIENSNREIDIQKAIDEANISKAKHFIESVSSKVEIKCFTINSTYRALFDNKNTNKFTEWLADNKLTLELKFHASMSISVEKIQFDIDKSGNVIVRYDYDNIKCDGIVIENYSCVENKHFFALSRSKDNLLACIEVASESVVNSINQDQTLITGANRGLENYLKDIARSFGVKSITFPSGYTEIINKESRIITQNELDNGIPIIYEGNVKYGYDPSQRMETPQYLVIHDTGSNAIGSSAKNHINWLNNDSENANATTFYVDSKSVYQALDFDKVGWAVGDGNNGIKNNNSYSIEMCRGTNRDIQLKTIENTRLLIKEIKHLYPNLKVVYHKDASSWGKNCPDLIFGKNPMFTKEELNKLLDI